MALRRRPPCAGRKKKTDNHKKNGYLHTRSKKTAVGELPFNSFSNWLKRDNQKLQSVAGSGLRNEKWFVFVPHSMSTITLQQNSFLKTIVFRLLELNLCLLLAVAYLHCFEKTSFTFLNSTELLSRFFFLATRSRRKGNHFFVCSLLKAYYSTIGVTGHTVFNFI